VISVDDSICAAGANYAPQPELSLNQRESTQVFSIKPEQIESKVNGITPAPTKKVQKNTSTIFTQAYDLSIQNGRSHAQIPQCSI
jgi:hypothetical protein